MMRKAALVALDTVFHAQDFVGCAAVIVALSGGGDSTALLLLLRDYLRQIPAPPRLVAVTVDHGLRAQSAREARLVAAFCAEQKIAHEIVRWAGKKPNKGVQARARVARYQLLYERACFHGAQVILTGHNFEDLAETYLMRAARIDCAQAAPILPRGLAAMARESLLFGEIRLIRPLLALRRADLRQFLTSQGLSWIDDPSNEDERFERVRVRHALDEATLQAAWEAAKQATIQRAYYNARCVAFLENTPIQRWGEVYQLDVNPTWFEDDFLPHYLADLACLVGGADYLRPAPAQFHQLKKHDKLIRFTWGGSIIEQQRQTVRLWRERRNLAVITVPAHSDGVWDNRYHIANYSGEEIVVRPPNAHEVRALAREFNMPARCLEATPVILGERGMDMAVVQNGFIYNKNISLRRILAPFQFLQVVNERDLISHWRQIFNIEVN